jgi:hypothetical protein|uniref:Uncharacterized protein n=1 Tax=Myoviridae sp. ctPuP5 TaxID=2823543 RepID=A0A8S5LA64_9CAUD|nr:MAG TPA: hypothetical protein [Myoviridae sp. ctPuP5]
MIYLCGIKNKGEKQMNKFALARLKRMVIQTALVEAHCQYNIEARDIVTKYVSTNVTQLNFRAYMNMAHERPTQFIDMCFGWYWCNVSPTYKGYGISYLFDLRTSLKRLINN